MEAKRFTVFSSPTILHFTNVLLTWYFGGFFIVYQSNYGSHFILGFTQQYSLGLYDGYNEITIIARFDAKVSVIMKDLVNTTSIKAGKVFTFTIPATFRMSGTGIEKKGIEIKSTTEIAVIGANYVYRTSDAFLALPTTTLGKTYVVATRLNSGLSSSVVNFGIISQRDGTQVTITLKTKGYFYYHNSTYTSGQSFATTLAKLETFHLMHNNDLSGTIITSSYPAAVVSGSPCENIGAGYCDHLVSFLLPAKKWGKQYILVPAIDSKSTGDFYRVFASQETMVKSRGLTTNLRRGEFLEINLTKNALSSLVSCDKPCQVIQYLKGAVLNRKPDPSTIILPSIEQFATSYKVVPILERQQFSNYIIIVIEEKSKDALKFNKTSDVKLNWQKVKDTEYAWAIHNISAPVDIESCNHDKKFGVIVAGYKLYDSRQSYGYPAGFTFPGMPYVIDSHPTKQNPEKHTNKSQLGFLNETVFVQSHGQETVPRKSWLETRQSPQNLDSVL